MFDGISGSYDRLNSLMSAGLHHRWRDLAVMLAMVEPGDSVLDVCTGTGDLAFALKRAVGEEGQVVGLDFSNQMLDQAREKCGLNQLGWILSSGTRWRCRSQTTLSMPALLALVCGMSRMLARPSLRWPGCVGPAGVWCAWR